VLTARWRSAARLTRPGGESRRSRSWQPSEASYRSRTPTRSSRVVLCRSTRDRTTPIGWPWRFELPGVEHVDRQLDDVGQTAAPARDERPQVLATPGGTGRPGRPLPTTRLPIPSRPDRRGRACGRHASGRHARIPTGFMSSGGLRNSMSRVSESPRFGLMASPRTARPRPATSCGSRIRACLRARSLRRVWSCRRGSTWPPPPANFRGLDEPALGLSRAIASTASSKDSRRSRGGMFARARSTRFSVAANPGQMAFTVTPLPATSAASGPGKADERVLGAVYAVTYGAPTSPAMDAC